MSNNTYLEHHGIKGMSMDLLLEKLMIMD